MSSYFAGKLNRIYIVAFVIGCSSLTIEIAFTRLLSVISYYHLAFFAVSTAMLGMTAGAVRVFTKENLYRGSKLLHSISNACLGFSISSVLSAVALCFIPVSVGAFFTKTIALLGLTFFCSLPFYFSGIIVTSLLTRSGFSVSRIYASDLIGASFGCLFVLAGLNYFDAVSFIILSGSSGVICFLLLNGKAYLKRSFFLIAGILLLSFFNRFTSNSIRPLFVKGEIENSSDHLLERWNSFSRVLIFQKKMEPAQLWGKSPAFSDKKTEQYFMSIDGDAATVVRKYSSSADAEHLGYDLTALAYYLRTKPAVCVIGVGGGKDVQTAIAFGSNKITGIDINPVFIDLLQHQFNSFSGLANHPEVFLKTDEARSFLSHSKDKYDIIQMSLVDTWAATGAGAFSLSENNLYTVEAWETFFNRLSDSGLLTVSRWYNSKDLGETGRLVSLAVASAFKAGISEPSRHIVLVTINNLANLIFSKRAFSETDILMLRQKISQLQFQPVLIPGEGCSNSILKNIINARSTKDLGRRVNGYALNYKPPTDENPYFFNMLKIGNLNFKSFDVEQGVMRGNLQATVTLLALIGCLLLFAIGTIGIPLFLKDRNFFSDKRTKYEATYFSLIGAGFMLTEIALIQRLSVFLGHPVYALVVLLFTMILSTGIGSLLSKKILSVRRHLLTLYPLIAVVAILGLGLLIPRIILVLITESMLLKVSTSALLIFPLGFCLGWFFPLGMKLVSSSNSIKTSWYWALNGIFGVLFSAIAVYISIYAGISYNFYIAACFYGLLCLIVPKLIS
jgi:spermidine synthase